MANKLAGIVINKGRCLFLETGHNTSI